MKKFGTYIKQHHSGIAFWVSAVVSILLLVGSFLCPPMGVIDTSAIAAVGWLFAFAALAVVPAAIKEGRGIKISKGDIELEVGGNTEN